MTRPLASCLLALAFTLAACGGGDENTPASPNGAVSSLTVAPLNATLDPGGTLQLTPEARGSNGSVVQVTGYSWSSGSNAIATVTSSGIVTAVAPGTTTITAAVAGKTAIAQVTVRNVYDIATLGVPKVITRDYIELSKVGNISRFRSGFGHDYSDGVEQCRSMKHYFLPRDNASAPTIEISAPADAQIASITQEMTFASQIQLVPNAAGAMTIILFHVVPDAGIVPGMTVTAGQRLGHHVGSQTASDVAVRVQTPQGQRLVSYFDAMTDVVFAAYQTRGVSSRQSMLLSQSARDAAPLTCNGEAFVGSDPLPIWVTLN